MLFLINVESEQDFPSVQNIQTYDDNMDPTYIFNVAVFIVHDQYIFLFNLRVHSIMEFLLNF